MTCEAIELAGKKKKKKAGKKKRKTKNLPDFQTPVKTSIRTKYPSVSLVKEIIDIGTESSEKSDIFLLQGDRKNLPAEKSFDLIQNYNIFLFTFKFLLICYCSKAVRFPKNVQHFCNCIQSLCCIEEK